MLGQLEGGMQSHNIMYSDTEPWVCLLKKYQWCACELIMWGDVLIVFQNKLFSQKKIGFFFLLQLELCKYIVEHVLIFNNNLYITDCAELSLHVLTPFIFIALLPPQLSCVLHHRKSNQNTIKSNLVLFFHHLCCQLANMWCV